MPVPLGYFISSHVYGSRLRTVHDIDDDSCIRFVDVWKGKEEKMGSSWTNSSEVSTMVDLVRNYYQSLNFCIITPYDAQRAEIQKSLKEEKLPWEHVFNVDSFQGNEADYLLISVVRSNGVGFLKSLNRTNVMLTRCRKGMVIVSSRPFLRSVAHDTLLGSEAWVEAEDVAESTVNLPGVTVAK
ncbi:hypothetical protein GYMLUDRAFT_77825 [Collybiopsis luxurians FD-317 M1]|uniref:DNA2/NAM7 helicase-like C-terminal domain-containing protein n=1 Tax=Collybiopsis luxurians FD-317 M1 TaxID=944289 RepID=A0A0D0CBX6_9AGAR|nr:hypothetical protein GYMLUDRAFT_77825 [Collybiopsis luxurians FD-317 M1]